MRSIAKILGVPHSWVQKVENGERRLDVVEYVRYCRALNVNPYEGLAYMEDLKPAAIRQAAEEMAKYN